MSKYEGQYGVDVEWVYVLRNPAFSDDLLKIGRTSRTPDARANELSSKTGVPEDYEVVAAYPTPNSKRLEKRVHRKLKIYRTDDRKEFFNVQLETAKRVIENTHNNDNALTKQSHNSSFQKSSSDKLTEKNNGYSLEDLSPVEIVLAIVFCILFAPCFVLALFLG